MTYIKRLKHLAFDGDLFELLYADDSLLCLPLQSFWLDACGHLLFLLVVGSLLSWSKTSVGLRFDWVGYAVDGLRFRCGITRERGKEIIKRLAQATSQGTAAPADLATAVNKLAWVVQALECLRPWLQPLYRFLHGPPEYIRLVIPTSVSGASAFLCEMLEQHRQLVPLELSFLSTFEGASDASATDDEVSVEGWLGPHCAPDSPQVSQWDVHWFYVPLSQRSCPWAFTGTTPQSRVPALELLGTLFLLMASLPRVSGHRFCIGLRQSTDNLGNGYILSKLFTSSQPGASVLMAISKKCLENSCMPFVQWKPRDLNKWADEASKGLLANFDPQKRIQIDMETLAWINDRVKESAEAEKRYEGIGLKLRRLKS